VLAATLLTGLATGLATATPADAATPGACRRVAVPVALAEGQASTRTVRGTYCRPVGAGRRTRVDVDVLVPGATYDRRYWDWPTNRARYSVVRRALAAGRATLALDRIGSGTSSYPAGSDVTMAADAHTVHQVISWLRANRPVHRVTLVGHSLGSGVAVTEAATYQDVDRLVLTGMLHSLGSGLAQAQRSFVPTSVPGGADGYLTTTPRARAALFFSASAEASVVAYDEARKGAVSATEFADYGTMVLPPADNLSRLVRAPVLLVAGQQDVLLCGGTLDCTDASAVRANEVAYFPQAPSVTTLTVPRTGHDLALHPSSGATSAQVNAWICTH
jgi:pimeloyl-ACP methyl ester carboxylesterase